VESKRNREKTESEENSDDEKRGIMRRIEGE